VIQSSKSLYHSGFFSSVYRPCSLQDMIVPLRKMPCKSNSQTFEWPARIDQKPFKRISRKSQSNPCHILATAAWKINQNIQMYLPLQPNGGVCFSTFHFLCFPLSESFSASPTLTSSPLASLVLLDPASPLH
jgi:hypothetical protein